MNTRRNAVGPAALLAAALLLAPTPPLPAQEVATEADLFRALTQEEQVRHNKYRERNELQQETRRQTMLAYIDMLRMTSPYLLGDFATTAIERIYIAGRNREVIPQIPLHLTAVNSYGTSYDVPHGNYSGNDIIAIAQDVTPQGGGGELEGGRYFTAAEGGRRSGHGWSFEPGGLLQEYYDIIGFTRRTTTTGDRVIDCRAVTRFTYHSASLAFSFLNRGFEQVCSYTVRDELNACVSHAPSSCDASRPTAFWSGSGHVALDVSNRAAPVLRFPDGRTETMGAAGLPYWLFNARLGEFGARFSLTHTRTGRNGNVTRFEYPSESLTKVIDPRGRETRYERDAAQRVKAIHAPGFAGQDLAWELTWTPFTWRPADTFPEVVCRQSGTEGPCEGPVSYTTLTRLSLPDGRAYVFTYEPWAR